MCFDSQAKEKEWVRFELKRQFQEALSSSDPKIKLDAINLTKAASFDVSMGFYLPTNKTDGNGQKNAKLWGFEISPGKPDLDNLEKFYLDCCNEIIFADDKQVCILQSKKKFAIEKKTIIEIRGTEPMQISNKVMEVLKMVNPEQIITLDEYVHELNLLTKEDQERFYEGDGGTASMDKNNRLTRAAQLLVMIADEFAGIFQKISKIRDC